MTAYDLACAAMDAFAALVVELDAVRSLEVTQ